MVVCINCGEQFEAKRSDAKICSDRCRQQAHRRGIKLRGQNKTNTAPISAIEAYLGASRAAAAENPMAQLSRLLPEASRKFDGISRITNVPKEEINQRVAEGIDRVTAGMSLLATWPTDYNELLRLAKAGVTYKDLFRKHIDALKLTPNQKSMIYSKLKN